MGAITPMSTRLKAYLQCYGLLYESLEIRARGCSGSGILQVPSRAMGVLRYLFIIFYELRRRITVFQQLHGSFCYNAFMILSEIWKDSRRLLTSLQRACSLPLYSLDLASW